MKNRNHVKNVGLLYMILGFIGLAIFPIAAYIGISDFFRILEVETKSVFQTKVQIFIWVGLLAILILSFIYIFVGTSIRSEKRWATRYVGFILALLTLWSFPIGTAIGIYAIWALNKVIKDEPTDKKVPSSI